VRGRRRRASLRPSPPLDLQREREGQRPHRQPRRRNKPQG